MVSDAAPPVSPCQLRVSEATSNAPVCSFAIRTATSIDSPPVDRKIERASDGGQRVLQRIRQVEHRRREHPRVEVDDVVERLLDGLGDARVVVADRGADLARGEVEHAAPGRRLEVRAAGPHDRLGPEVAAVADQTARIHAREHAQGCRHGRHGLDDPVGGGEVDAGHALDAERRHAGRLPGGDARRRVLDHDAARGLDAEPLRPRAGTCPARACRARPRRRRS